MKKILFPTDFSNTSKNAFIYALQLAKSLQAEVITLHVYELPALDYIDVPAYLMDIYETVELSNFENYKSEVPALRAIAEEHNLTDIPISNVMMSGDLVTTIERMINVDRIDYVVMGTSGASGFIDTFFGTSTAKVMTDTSAFVLGIPEQSKYEPIQRITFTTRFKDKDMVALNKVLALAKGLGAHIDCLNIKKPNTPTNEVVVADWKFLFRNDAIDFHILESEDVEGAIVDFIEAKNSNMLVLLNNKRSFFERLFEKSLTKKMAFHVKIPLLAVHE